MPLILDVLDDLPRDADRFRKVEERDRYPAPREFHAVSPGSAAEVEGGFNSPQVHGTDHLF